MPPPTIRPLIATDIAVVAEQRHALWPDGTVESHAEDLRAILAGTHSTLSLATFVALEGDRVVGFADVGLRSHADGCDPALPVAFLEGWFVVSDRRRAGIGAALVDAAETWARDQGCNEIASDTWIDDREAEAAHVALGYEVVDRCINFKKRL